MASYLPGFSVNQVKWPYPSTGRIFSPECPYRVMSSLYSAGLPEGNQYAPLPEKRVVLNSLNLSYPVEKPAF